MKWIVDVYHNTPHRGLSGKTPLEVWRELEPERIIELPANPLQLDVIASHTAHPTIFHYGVQVDNLFYNSPELREIAADLGANQIVEARYREEDVGSIFVRDPRNDEFFEVPATNREYAAGLNRAVHRLIVAQARKRFGDDWKQAQLLEVRAEIQAIVDAALKAKKTIDRKRAAQVLMQDSEAVFESSTTSEPDFGGEPGKGPTVDAAIGRGPGGHRGLRSGRPWHGRGGRGMNLSDLLNLGLNPASPYPFRNFTLRKQRIHHEVFCEGVRMIARVHERGLESGTAEGLLIVAQSGGGKTSLAEYYESQCPRCKTEEGHVIPVLLVNTPEDPSVKTFAQAILLALGDPAFDRGTAETKTQRLIVLLKKCKVQLLLVDEFQHFFDGHRTTEAKRITDWLKNLLNAVRIPVVLFGLPRSIAVLRLNPQLRRRFAAPHYLQPFGLEQDSFRQLRNVLRSFQRKIPVPCVELHDVDVARRFYFATNGLIDYIVKILDHAVSTCQLKDGEQLDLPHFAAAFREAVWGEAPDQLNPFCKDATLRPLMGPREPFDSWDDPQKYLVRPRNAEQGGKK